MSVSLDQLGFLNFIFALVQPAVDSGLVENSGIDCVKVSVLDSSSSCRGTIVRKAAYDHCIIAYHHEDRQFLLPSAAPRSILLNYKFISDFTPKLPVRRDARGIAPPHPTSI